MEKYICFTLCAYGKATTYFNSRLCWFFGFSAHPPVTRERLPWGCSVTTSTIYTPKNEVGFTWKEHNSLSNEVKEEYFSKEWLTEKRELNTFCIKGLELHDLWRRKLEGIERRVKDLAVIVDLVQRPHDGTVRRTAATTKIKHRDKFLERAISA